jgi:hypothetical protein
VSGDGKCVICDSFVLVLVLVLVYFVYWRLIIV